MPVCTKTHQVQGTKTFLPHDYVAGNCIQHGAQSSLGFRLFLLALFPDYRSSDYKLSRQRHYTPAPVDESSQNATS